MATSNTNYSRPKDNNYNKTKGSNYKKTGDSSFSKQKSNNYSKPTDNNFRNNNFKNRDRNSNFDKNSYSGGNKPAYNKRQDSEKESNVDNDVFFEKLEAQKRLDREIKIKRRKDKKEDTTPKIKKSNGKAKRLKNIDWTKGYEDGLFEEDGVYDDYMR